MTPRLTALTLLLAWVLWQNTNQATPTWTALGTYAEQAECLWTMSMIPAAQRWHPYTMDDRGMKTEQGTPRQFQCLQTGVTP